MLLELADFDFMGSLEAIPFSDIPFDAWYTKYVEYAYRKGIVDGHSGSRFRPGDIVTRAEVAEMVSRIIEKKLKRKEGIGRDRT